MFKNYYWKLFTPKLRTQEENLLSTCFQVKDKCKFDHRHDLLYHAKGPCELYNKNQGRECGRRIDERIKDHNKRDDNLLNHSLF